MKTTIQIAGTHCASCKALIEDIAHDVPGIVNCSVDFKSGKTEVEHTDTFDWTAFQKALSEVGEYHIEQIPTTL